MNRRTFLQAMVAVPMLPTLPAVPTTKAFSTDGYREYFVTMLLVTSEYTGSIWVGSPPSKRGA